jgi:hypothetical protein
MILLTGNWKQREWSWIKSNDYQHYYSSTVDKNVSHYFLPPISVGRFSSVIWLYKVILPHFYAYCLGRHKYLIMIFNMISVLSATHYRTIFHLDVDQNLELSSLLLFATSWLKTIGWSKQYLTSISYSILMRRQLYHQTITLKDTQHYFILIVKLSKGWSWWVSKACQLFATKQLN